MSCSASMSGEMPKVLEVHVTSRPTGSDIYVDGRLSGQSNVTLSVPYYSFEQRKIFLLRHDGYFPCTMGLALAARENPAVSCDLRKVGE